MADREFQSFQTATNITVLHKVLEVHEKSDLVPAPVHEEKNDCVPQSDHEIWQKSDLSSRSRSRSWHIIICFKSRVEVTNFDISQNISGMLNTFDCSKMCFIKKVSPEMPIFLSKW